MALAHTVGAGGPGASASTRGTWIRPTAGTGRGWPSWALAIITAAATWWHLGSVVGRDLSAAVRRRLRRRRAWAVPILLALLAWRYLRHPDRNADTARMVIGWTALIIGALGLVHIAHGTPRPARRHGRDPGGGRLHRLRGVGAAGRGGDARGSRRRCSR